MVPLLLQLGADVGAKDNNHVTALHRAARRGNTAAIVPLVQAGADVNAKNAEGRAPLSLAYEYPETLAELIKAGANVDATNENGRTMLQEFISNVELVNTLLNAGANPNVRTDQGETPLHRAGILRIVWTAEVVAMLLEAGADIEAKDNEGNTPLRLAGRFASIKGIEALLSHSSRGRPRWSPCCWTTAPTPQRVTARIKLY